MNSPINVRWSVAAPALLAGLFVLAVPGAARAQNLGFGPDAGLMNVIDQLGNLMVQAAQQNEPEVAQQLGNALQQMVQDLQQRQHRRHHRHHHRGAFGAGLMQFGGGDPNADGQGDQGGGDAGGNGQGDQGGQGGGNGQGGGGQGGNCRGGRGQGNGNGQGGNDPSRRNSFGAGLHRFGGACGHRGDNGSQASGDARGQGGLDRSRGQGGRSAFGSGLQQFACCCRARPTNGQQGANQGGNRQPAALVNQGGQGNRNGPNQGALARNNAPLGQQHNAANGLGQGGPVLGPKADGTNGLRRGPQGKNNGPNGGGNHVLNRGPLGAKQVVHKPAGGMNAQNHAARKQGQGAGQGHNGGQAGQHLARNGGAKRGGPAQALLGNKGARNPTGSGRAALGNKGPRNQLGGNNASRKPVAARGGRQAPVQVNAGRRTAPVRAVAVNRVPARSGAKSSGRRR